MTATERAKRSDALYYETVSVTRRVLCDMIANREADLEDARAENDRLRELVRDMWLHSYCSISKTREEDEHHIERVIDRMRELGVAE